MPINFIHLGVHEYRATLEMQFQLREERLKGQIEDTILTVEHPRVITEGRRPASEDFLRDPGSLAKEGFAVEKVNRGGRLTYHGPGQLVLYFILALPPLGLKVPAFVRWVEEIGIQTLRTFGVSAERRDGYPGLWIQEKKIGSIGLAVDRGISMHGMALNIHPNLSDFKVIIPCGMSDCEITSLQSELEESISLEDVVPVFCQKAEEIYKNLPAQLKISLG